MWYNSKGEKMILDNINPKILNLSKQAEIDLQDIYREVEEICLYNSNRILSAFIANKVEFSDFTDRNGYNHHDTGREKLEKIFASVLGTEDALVRVQIMSGTNALYLAFSALLKYGDTMISISGKPYDSLLEMVGLIGNSTQSLKANGIKYEQIDLIDNQFDVEKIKARLARHDVRLVAIQRSRGYSSRNSLTIAQIEAIIKEIRSVNDEVIVMVDNCYGNWWNEKTGTRRSRHRRRIIDEKSRGRHCDFGRIYRRKSRVYRDDCGQVDRSWHWKGFGSQL